MSLARTLRLKKVVITSSKLRYQAYLRERGGLAKDYLWVTKAEQLKGLHYHPIQNCEIVVLGNHPIIGTAEYRRLMEEQALSLKPE